MRVLSVVGARPQFVKLSAVSTALAGRDIDHFVIHTGQHYDDEMSARFFEDLGITDPDLNLGVGSGSHADQTGRTLQALGPALERVRPDAVVVYGDTNSTLAGALTAAKLGMRVAHVEAGLRSFNRTMPEELNRIVADHLSDLLFAPTAVAVDNLVREGCAERSIHLVGDVMYDVAVAARDRAIRRASALDQLGLRGRSYVLATIHRAENTDDPERLKSLSRAFQVLAREIEIVFPLHPRTATKLGSERDGLTAAGVRVIDPLGYLDMTQLEFSAAVIATDSGGVQKEAFFHRVPCVTLRTETEWTELVDLGWNRLAAPTDADAVVGACLGAIGSEGVEAAPYGDGHAAERIVAELEALLEGE